MNRQSSLPSELPLPELPLPEPLWSSSPASSSLLSSQSDLSSAFSLALS